MSPFSFILMSHVGIVVIVVGLGFLYYRCNRRKTSNDRRKVIMPVLIERRKNTKDRRSNSNGRSVTSNGN